MLNLSSGVVIFVCCVLMVRGYSIDQRGWSAVNLAEKEVRAPSVSDEPQESVLDSINHCPEDDDLTSNTTIACHGVKIVRRVMAQLLDQGTKRNIQLSDGVEFIKVEDGSRNLGDDNSLTGRLQGFFKNHELRIKLEDFAPKVEEWGRSLNGSLQQIAEGRGKNKGGGGALLAMGLMMKAMLAAIGMGGLGLLAMKALMVSAMALMLSAIVGIKKLASKDEGGGHYVSVVPVHHGGGGHDSHYRRKREEPDVSPYRGYAHYAPQE